MSELHIRRWNEGASAPLIIPVSVLVNTPAEVLFDHIRTNSRNIQRWIKQEVQHDGIALLCGSGPSLRENLADIKQRQSEGAKVFALNAAATYLSDHGIMPDYQVIIDAKEESVSLIGPAKDYLFGSTVDPQCFNKKPLATLFQLQVDDDDLQAEIDRWAPHEYGMVSTAVSVGIVSTILTFAMGYRTMHCYGYDSSHKGNDSHVVRQQMNDDVACMEVTFAGKEYLASLPMKLQAERFMQVAHLLQGEGCKFHVHGYGLLPDMWNAAPEGLSEREKYFRMWSMIAYRQDSPAERIIGDIIWRLNPTSRILDFGCGTGRAALEIKKLGYDVLMLDFASNCLDDLPAQEVPFVEVDLAEPMPFREQYGYCIDVMEHIPTDDVVKVLTNIMNAARKVFFQISTVDDKMGATIGARLHLTVQPHEWWRGLILSLGYQIEHEDRQDIASVFVLTTTSH
jgi:SAM-dependent methyltransferase